MQNSSCGDGSRFLRVAASSNTNNNQIVFIDSAVQDREIILTSLTQGTTWHLLDSTRDGLRQMADILADYSGLDAIHVISHGAEGSLQLGNNTLTQAVLGEHREALASIGAALKPGGDLLLYGCEVAKGETGKSFIAALAQATGADIAASLDMTGFGGNWNLEVNTGPVVANLEFQLSGYSDSLSSTYSSHTNYDLALAIDLAELSAAAYSDGAELARIVANLGWSLVDELNIFSVNPVVDAQAIIVERTLNGGKQMAIAFRGTAGIDDILTDASPYGFSEYYLALRPQIEAAIVSTVTARDGLRCLDGQAA